MALPIQCSVTLQDCAERSNPPSIAWRYGSSSIPFTKQSCVRDKRQDGDIGRCGFPGALCVTNGLASNCATGRAQTCVHGVCQGAPGWPCTFYNSYDCNGVTCAGGVCGGNESTIYALGVDNNASEGAIDYCVSGRGFQRGPNGPWYCSAATSFAINATRTAEFLTPTTTPLQMPQMKSPGARVITSSVLIGLLLVFAIFIALWRILSARRVSARESEKVHHDQKVEAPLLASDQAPNVSVAQIPAHVKNSKVEQSDKPFNAQTERGRLLRLLISLVLLSAYCIFSILLCTRPVILKAFPVSRSTEIKGFVTIISVLWQNGALIPVHGILTGIFASEWSYLFESTGMLIPGNTDRVSTQTAGIVDQAKHLHTSIASWAFRLAFFTLIGTIALTAVSPAAFTVGTVHIPRQTRVEAGSFCLSCLDLLLPTPQERAALATQMEYIARTPFMFNTTDTDTIIGFPSPNALAGLMAYRSDVVRFNYACRFTAPTLLDVNPPNGSVVLHGVWSVDDGHTDSGSRDYTKWSVAGGGDAPSSSSVIGPFTITGVFPLVQSTCLNRTCASSYGVSAWLFIGDRNNSLDLGDAPATFNESRWRVSETDTLAQSFRALNATVLVCDPRFNVTSGHITFDSRTNSLTVSEITNGPLVGNIPPDTAAFVLSRVLLDATTSRGDLDPATSRISAQMFVHDFNFVNSAANISSTIGRYVSTAAKAWSDGLWDTNNRTTMAVDAIVQEEGLALVGSRPLTLLTCALTLFVLTMTAGQLLWDGRAPLGIGSLMQALQAQQPPSNPRDDLPE